MKKLFVAAATATLLTVGVAPALAVRDNPGPTKKGVTWSYDGGAATDPGVSADGPRKSNAYAMVPGSYVYPSGYWDLALKNAAWKVTYKASELVGPGQLRWSVELVHEGGTTPIETSGGTRYGTIVYLDAAHCSVSTSGGWTTVDFKAAGPGCTIYTSSGQYVGTETSSAWSQLVAALGDVPVWNSYLIVDEAGAPITVDRVTVGGNVLSSF